MADEIPEKPPSFLMRLTRLVGVVLMVVSCAYVVRELWRDNDLLRALEFSGGVGGALGVAVMMWVVLNVCLGWGWRPLVFWAGGRISNRDSIELSMRTQVAKYLPGNVFHIAGRVLLAREFGVTAAQAGFTTALESLLLVGMAVAIGLPFLLLAPGSGIFASLTLVAVGAIVLTMSSRVRRLLQSRFGLAMELPAAAVVACLVRAGLSYLWVFVLQAGMFVVIAHAVLPEFAWSAFTTLQAVAVSWVAGFVVIGAPGGLGVRELVFGLFADATVGQPELLLVAALMRGCSIAGDLICLGIGTAMRSARSTA